MNGFFEIVCKKFIMDGLKQTVWKFSFPDGFIQNRLEIYRRFHPNRL